MRYVYTHSLLQIIFLTPFFTSVFLCEAGIFGQSPSATAEQKWKTKTQAQKKPSLLKVDPQNIVRLICKYAGVVMPASVTRDMEIISSVCNCNDVSLDLINKELLIHNFTVTMPSPKRNKQKCTALSVGTISMSWDSYLQPCIDIIVGDVDILVEFVNLMLTKNNWNELADIGFPPELYDSTDTSASSTFIRIGSIQTMGQVRLKIRSRPLNKDMIEDIIFDLRKIQEIDDQIKTASKVARQRTGRRGIQTDQLYEIINNYFNFQIQQFLKVALADIALGALNGENSETIKGAKKLFSTAIDIGMKYTKDIGDKADETIHSSFDSLGIERQELNIARDILKSSTGSLFSKLTGDKRFGGPHEDDDRDNKYSNIYVVETDDESETK